MTDRAAFSACYSDWKLIRTRAVVQIVLEVPVEQADHAYNVLGGMPNSAKEIWVGVARFKPGTEVMPNQGPGAKTADKTALALDSTTPARAHNPFFSRPLSQQAALLCRDPVFQKFIDETSSSCESDVQAAFWLRHRCGVSSRADIKSGTVAATHFTNVREQFLAWKMVPV